MTRSERENTVGTSKVKKVLPILLLIWLAGLDIPAKAQPVVIGYTNCLAVTNYSASLMNQLGRCKWYFAHASVGACMMEGLGNLHLSNTNLYLLQGESASNSPPAATQAGKIYADNRGNPLPYGNYQAKLDLFRTAVSNGWHFPAVNIALTKLCFVDIWDATTPLALESLLESYVNTIANLEAAYPQTVFVYATMPLTTTNYRYLSIDIGAFDIYWRNVFNDSLRSWCNANNRVLLDIADIEAHDTNGNLCTITYDSRVCQQLWWGHNEGCGQYCSEAHDGAHPTNLESEQLMARGFYALSAATVNRWRPQPAIGSFTISEGTALITWNAVAGHTYRLQFRDSSPGAAWKDAQPDIVAAGPIASATHSFGTASATFYRVQLLQ